VPPRFLFVDDNIEEVAIERFQMISHDSLVRVPPDAVSKRLVDEAAVILVDFVIDDWREGALADGADPALLPGNGLALLGVLRSLVEGSDLNRWHAPKAFALLTAEPAKLSPLRGSQREHAIARLRDVEWVFEKPALGEGWASLECRFVSLGAAVERMPQIWPSEEATLRVKLYDLLGLDSARPWADGAWNQVISARAPINELSTATHGNIFLRWLLHRALPYPGVFIDEIYLAARLRTTREHLTQSLASNQRLRNALEPTKYGGILAEFDDPHYWRAGVEAALWELTSGRPFDIAALADLVEPWNENRDRELVVCLDEKFTPDPSRLYEADEVLRVLPDDWPPFADQAYMTRDVVHADAALFGIVAPDDRELLT
jgi:hypothetical protein